MRTIWPVDRVRAVWRLSCAIPLGLFLSGVRAERASLPPYALSFSVASPQEQTLLIKSVGATLVDGARHAEPGQFCVYGLPLPAGARCRLEATVRGSDPDSRPDVTVLGADNKPLATKVEIGPNTTPGVVWTVPGNWPLGQRMRVILSAKHSPYDLQSLHVTVTDRDTRAQGVPDALAVWMAEGLPGAHIAAAHPSDHPTTLMPVSGPPSPESDPLTDVVLLTDPDTPTIAAWKAEGYVAWSQHKPGGVVGAAQPQQPSHTPTADQAPLLAAAPLPTPDLIAAERTAEQPLLDSGADGILIAGTNTAAQSISEPGFRPIWTSRLKSPWQNPASSLDLRYQADRLLAQITAERVNTLLQAVAEARPAAERIVALPSPLQTLLAQQISPAWQILTEPSVQDVVGSVNPATMLTPARNNGALRTLPFDQAYLGYSALLGVGRDTTRRLWFAIDPPAPEPQETPQTAKARYEQQVTAALMFPEVTAFQLPASPTSSPHQPDDLVTETAVIDAVLAQMAAQPRENAATQSEIGLLLGDAAQWQHSGPNTGDLDGLYGLALPLLQRGVPVQIASLERTVDPGYLNRFKVLLLSYDYQKPLGPQTQAALSDWVRRGGSLLLFGGSDPYNAITNSWWQQARLASPQADLFAQLGLDLGGAPVTTTAAPHTVGEFQALDTQGPGARTASVELSRQAAQTGSVAIRFRANRAGGGPAAVTSVELRIGGQIAASFVTGSDLENRFLVTDRASRFGPAGRTVEDDGDYIYQFDNLPRGVPISMQVTSSGPLVIEAAPVQPDFGNTLLATGAISGLADLFPRLRIGTAYSATIYPVPATAKVTTAQSPSARVARTAADDGAPLPLYSLRSGGTPIWMQTIGRGHLFYVGVSAAFFSSSARSGGLLRTLTRLAVQRAGGTYREPGSLRVQRGRFTIVRTFSASRLVEGRTIDLFSPSLTVAEDRTIPPSSVALLCDLGPVAAPPHLAFVVGDTEARVEADRTTAFFVRGPMQAPGLACLHRGNRQLAGIRAVDRLGRQVPIQAEAEGGTLMLRYKNDPAGIAIRVGWR
jgi:hypothetical protein